MSLVRLLVMVAALFACSINGDSVQQESSAGNQPVPNLYPVTINDKCGFIDESGNLKFMLPDDIYNTRRFSEGLAVVGRRFQRIYGRWGFVDHTGKIVIETKFKLAMTFSEGLAAVIASEEMGSAAGKIGYIDKTGSFVIQPQFNQGSVVIDYAFSEGLAAVPSGSHYWGYIDKTGKFVIDGRFTEAFPFSEGRALVGIAESYTKTKYGFIDKQGRWIVESQFARAADFSEGLAPVVIGEKLGFIDLQGQILIKPQFVPNGQCRDTGGISNSRFSEGLAAVNVDYKWGFIDRSGQWVIKPAWDCALPFSEGLAVVGLRDRKGRFVYGYIDKTGSRIIQPQFSTAQPFKGKLASVGVGGEDFAALEALEAYKAGKSDNDVEKILERNETKYGYIDRTGKFVWKPTN